MDFSTADAHQLHLSAHNQFNHQQGSGSPSYSRVSTLDPALGPQHMPHNFYGEVRSSIPPSTPSNSASPNFSTLSPSTKQVSRHTPTDRSLPSPDVSDDTLDEAYAAFILYCNPSFDTSTDTTELTKLFRVPPKSDGKSFSTWSLFELIRKFDQKDIKTWTQLALDLGVEPPSIEKRQSTQKVQQYSVRLKRWMRAMHIDAFFEFLLGKQHPYYTQIPSPQNPFPENGRDGVPLEEDLAVRALEPKLKPKRGRRKTEDVDDDQEETGTPPPKRPHIDTSLAFNDTSNYNQPQSAYPQSAMPISAHPDDMDRFSAQDPWTSAPVGASSFPKGLTPHSATVSNQQLRWRMSTQDNPTTPHPLSAVTPATAQLPDSAFDEPQSAVTPSTAKSRARRRHGPAVSSAWSGTNSTPNGKLRGRPPSNRSIRDGPYTTFPANPKTKEGPTIDLSRSTPGPTPVAERGEPASAIDNQNYRFPPTPASAVSVSSQPQSLRVPSGRPERLQLQVPQHIGGPVHLVSPPPPTLLVNGEIDSSGSSNPAQGQLAPSALPAESSRNTPTYFSENSHTVQTTSTRPPQTRHLAQPQKRTSQAEDLEADASREVPFESVRRALAADLLRADVEGRKRLRGTEAKGLADVLLRRLKAHYNPRAQVPATHLAIVASFLGLAPELGINSQGFGGTKSLSSQRYRVGGDGYDSPIDDDDYRPEEGERIRESIDLRWSVALGDLRAECAVKGLVLNSEETASKSAEGCGIEAESESDLKEKVKQLQDQLKTKEEEIRTLRATVLDAVL